MKKIIVMFITFVCILCLSGCAESTSYTYAQTQAISTPNFIFTPTPTNKTFISTASPQEPIYIY